MRRRLSAIAFTGSLLVAGPGPARGGDEPGIFVTGDLSFVLTTGNAEAGTLAFKGDLRKNWLRTSFLLNSGGLRADSSEAPKLAVGTPTSFSVVEPERVASAESFFANTGFERKVTERFFWHIGGGWERNRFSGIDSRFVGAGGLGYVLAAGETADFRAALAATFTRQDEIVQDPATEDQFAGARFSWEYKQTFGRNKSTTLTHTLVADQNLKETKDVRADTTGALAVAMSEKLALKVGVRVAYDNLPALQELQLVAAPGATTREKVTVARKKTDTTVSVSLVLTLSRKGGATRRTP